MMYFSLNGYIILWLNLVCLGVGWAFVIAVGATFNCAPRVYSWLCKQESLLINLEDPKGYWKSKPGQPCVRQVSYLLYSLSVIPPITMVK